VRVDHDDATQRQGEPYLPGRNELVKMSDTQLGSIARLQERLEALKERL
jgi:hypothetical protein